MSERPAGWLSDRELTEVDSAEHAFASPVPTQIVSNGEYNPLPQTESQRKVEGLIKELADKRAKRLSSQFIFDDQTHFVRDDFDKEGILGLGKYAVEHWNPKMSETPMTLARYKFENYLKEIYLDSDTKVALLSTAPFDDPSWWLLFNNQIADARAAINKVAGSRRLVGHSVFTPGQPGWMDEVDKAIAEYK